MPNDDDKYIKVTDLTSPKDEGRNRVVTFAIGEKKAIPNTMRLMGVLPHNTTITFDRESAKKMRDFCQGILDCYDR